MDYENKYKQALERAKKLHKDAITLQLEQDIKDYEYIFPELKESEDEKIKNEIILYIGVKNDIDLSSHNRWLSWLEKQGEQKPKNRYTFNSIPRLLDMIEPSDRAKSYCQKLIDTLLQEGYVTDAKIVSNCLKQMNGEKVAMATMDEQKPADKIEPKFKVGDWVTNGHATCQITFIDSRYWYSKTCVLGNVIDIDKTFHLWSIQDAKDGNILYFNDDTIVIFKDLYNSSTFHSYCHIENGIFDISKDELPDWWEGKGFKPATKEQRNLLYQKMKEAGYEWDADKRELKKIEQKPAWSEEDEKMKDAIYSCVDLHYDGLAKTSLLIWLKSLKDRYIWKPSEKQITVLKVVKDYAVSNNWNDYICNTLKDLLEQLEKL